MRSKPFFSQKPIPTNTNPPTPQDTHTTQPTPPSFDVDAWFATSEMIAEPQKMMLELVVSWRGGIIDICHYRTPKRITFGNDPRADFCYSLDDLPLPSQRNLFPLIEPGGEGFMLGFHTEMQGTVEHNGESFTLRELVKAGRAHYFARSGCCYYPLSPGVRIHLDLNGLDLYLQFVPVPPMQFHRLRQMGLQAPVLSFSVIAHLLFVLFAVSSGSSTPQESRNQPTKARKAPRTRALYFDPIHLGPQTSSPIPECPPSKTKQSTSPPSKKRPKKHPLHTNPLCTPAE